VIPVSERALIQRINRNLRPKSEQLHVCRKNSEWFHDLGRFHTIQHGTNQVGRRWLDLESYGRELGVLSKSETLSDGGAK